MRQNEHKNQGFLMLPGDVSYGRKITMVEGEDTPQAKSFRADRKARAAKLQRQRDQMILRDELVR